MYVTDLEFIKCPYCENKIRVVENYSQSSERLDYAIVSCSCSQFPITEGILNFGGKYRLGLDQAIKFLKKGLWNKACTVQMETESLPLENPLRILRKLSIHNIPFSKRILSYYRQRYNKNIIKAQTFFNALNAFKGGSFHKYLEYRYALPSFYSVIPQLILIKEINPKVIIDLGCGTGHFSYVLSKLCPKSKLICIDQYYVYLFLAKRFICPDALYICADITERAPLAIEPDLIFCSDVMWTQHKRKNIVDNYCSLLPMEGYFISPRLDCNWTGDFTLSLKEWKNLFQKYRHSFFSETKIMLNFARKDSINFNEVFFYENKTNYDSICMIASKKTETGGFKVENISKKIAKCIDSWKINPAYQEIGYNKSDRIFKLLNKMPVYEKEWELYKRFVLPEEVKIPVSSFVKDQLKADYKELPDLIRSGVAVIKR